MSTAEFDTPYDKLDARRQERQDRGPRRPQDRRQAEPLRPKFLTDSAEVEFNGRTYTVNPQVLDDWDLLEDLANDRISEQTFMMRQYLGLLGKDGMANLKDDLREDFGYVSSELMGKFIQAVTEQVDSGN